MGVVAVEVRVVHGCRAEDPVGRGALEQAFDRDFELLAGTGVRNGRDLEDLVGDVAG